MTRLLTLLFVVVFTISVIQLSAQVPKLSSYPSASATIFYDFDGQTVNSPYWNGGVSFYCTPPALTNDQITTLFNQVAEDYRPFNVNVTTDSAVYFAAPVAKRQRIIVTANSVWYGNAGGVAYVGSFAWGLEIPGFVFSSLLGNNVKAVGDAAAHEAGHTLGLNHQSLYDANCNFVNEYNPGAGSGEIGWAPIMGNSYSKNLSLWNKGSSNLGCNVIQDDLKILSGVLGYRADDVASVIKSATPLAMSGQLINASGLINSTTDSDMFKITLNERGRLNLNTIPFNTGSGYIAADIDADVELLSSTGVLIKKYNPGNSVQALIDTILNAGTYYINISNAGNSFASNYGMLGSYTVSGTFQPADILPIHSLSLNGAATNSKHELNWNILADEPIETITLEISIDGKTFKPLQQVDAVSTRFSYQPSVQGTVLYRLHAVTASQLKYYSNVVSLREVKTGKKYSLVSNLIQNNNICINSNGNYAYRVVDLNGRNMASGNITNGFNTINTAVFTNGMYLLQVMDGITITTEKIIKQ